MGSSSYVEFIKSISNQELLSHHFYMYNGSSLQHKIVDTDGSCSPKCGSLTVYNPVNGSFTITEDIAEYINACLNTCNVILDYSTDIKINSNISWNTSYSLTLRSQNNILFAEGITISSTSSSTLNLMAGIENKNGFGTVTFLKEAKIEVSDGSKVKIYYNPQQNPSAHKYHNPYPYHLHVSPIKALEGYMLVNNIQDLQDINYFLSGNYALSQDIQGTQNDKNFMQIAKESKAPFSGNFDGNDFTIKSLNIDVESFAGIFRLISGSAQSKAVICNLKLQSINVKGYHHVGILSGDAEHVVFSDIIFISDNHVSGKSIVGGLLGTGSGVELRNIHYKEHPTVRAEEFHGLLAGALRNSDVAVPQCCSPSDEIEVGCVGLLLETECFG